MDDKKIVPNDKQVETIYKTLAKIFSKKFNVNITVTVKRKPEFEEDKTE